MRYFLLVLIIIFTASIATSQALYRQYPSDVLRTDRNIKILKPRNYAENPEKTYPLILVLDGDYLFEPVAGNVDYLSYWDQMPEAFVVGINQRQSRYEETAIDINNGMPEPQSLKFMDFVMEVRQTMLDEYRVAQFTVIIGQDITANLSSYYLMRSKVPIQGLIHIDPAYSQIIEENLINKLGNLKNHNFLYTATSDKKDATEIMYQDTDSLFKKSGNTHIKYETLSQTNKYNVAASAIPRGLLYIFNDYRLINPQLFLKETLTDPDTTKKDKKAATALSKLQEKYAFIKDVYGVNMKVRLVDLVNITNYLIDNKEWNQLLDISAFTAREYPDILYGRFIEGLAYEGLERPDRALKSYNAAYVLKPAVGVETEDVLDKIELLQTKK